MRISAALALIITTPALLLTACTDTSTQPFEGTVVEKEHEPTEYGTKTVPVTSRQCTRSRDSKGLVKTTCKTVTTGHKTIRYLKKSECYELDVRLDDSDDIAEICDEAAYKRLYVGARYSSGLDYSEVPQ